ncbi:hypothetical protein KQX54_014793 [Cotesia glomerata]|uniref:Uncharacterized protein n=1 Tax=Cotesia glomerata TaxID=32391 RepID=A0AAV7IMJ6_COTGL|nr:hypothetical protein KQX54_014793 [Cotesia glomerata]
MSKMFLLVGNNSFSFTDLFSNIYISTSQLKGNDSCLRSCVNINTVEKLDCVKQENSENSNGTQSLKITEYCSAKPCHGRIHKCFVKNSQEFCELPPVGGRRYRWLLRHPTEDMRKNCPGRVVNIMTKNTCSDCFCQCSEEGAESTATRTVSFLPQYADVKNNMVVSDVKLIKEDNVVQIKIEQAKLLPQGKLDEKTRAWVPVDILIYQQNVSEGAFWASRNNSRVPLVKDVDYTFLNHEKRRLNLDDVLVDKDWVITGARFRNSEDGGRTSAIQLEVFKTKYDYQTGLLSSVEEEQHVAVVANNITQSQNSHYHTKRSAKRVVKRRDPAGNFTTELISLPNQYLEFRLAQMMNFNESVVPFLDARPAAEKSVVPYSGIGIVYRSSRTLSGTPGVISLRLFGIDHSKLDKITFV